MKAAGVYVHVPFCLRKCAYCDFCSYVGLESLYTEYIKWVRQEMAVAGAAWGGTDFDTLYIGGGTPTVVPTRDLVGLVKACRESLSFISGFEATIEANPGTVTLEALNALREAGINRLSLGFQSLQDDELALLGRIHTADEAREAYDLAREAGYTNINLDLMYGLPGQSVGRWVDTLRQIVALRPEHLSLYGLMLEEGTPLASRIGRGDLPDVDEEVWAEMFRTAEEVLSDAGYIHYEISNWARRTPGDRAGDVMPVWSCRHNIKYWRNERYMGLGAAAYSYDGNRRYGNISDPREYIRRVGEGASPVVEEEVLQREGRIGETMMLGLRLVRGVSHAAFESRFATTLQTVYGEEIGDLVSEGLLEEDAVGIRLTPRGRLLGNRVFAAFLADSGRPQGSPEREKTLST